MTIESACNKVLSKKFLKSETTGLLPPGSYSANNRYSKKGLMWLLHMEQEDDFRCGMLETAANSDHLNYRIRV